MPRRGFVCGSEESSLLGVNERIAPGENAERRERLKTRGGRVRTSAPEGERGDAFFNAVLGGGDELCCRGRGGCAKVGNKVRDGEVGLVPDGGDDGKLGGGDDAGQGLVVEAGEVFHGTSAACDDDDVD